MESHHSSVIQTHDHPLYHQVVAAFLFLSLFFFPFYNQGRNLFLMTAMVSSLLLLRYTDLRTVWEESAFVRYGVLLFLGLSIGALYGPSTMGRAVSCLWKYRRFLYPLLLIPLFSISPISRRWFRYGLYASNFILLSNALYLHWIIRQPDRLPAVNPIYTSFLVALTMGIVLVRLVSKKHDALDGWAWGIIVVYMSFFCTQRTSFLGYLGTLLVIFIWGWKESLSKKLTLAVFIVPPIVLLSFGYFGHRLHKMHQEFITYRPKDVSEEIHQDSMGARLDLLYTSWRLFKERPYLGWGIGGLATEFTNRQYRALSGDGPNNLTNAIADPHNQFALIGVENGLFGLTLFLAWWIALVYSAWRSPCSAEKICIICMAFCLFVGCMSGLALFIGAMSDAFILAICWVLAGGLRDATPCRYK